MASTQLIFDDFPYICRLCLLKGDNLKLIEHDFLDILKRIAHFKFEPDELPRNVCKECISKLEYISSCIDSWMKSEIHLKTILKNRKIEQHSKSEDLYEEHFSPKIFENNLNETCEIEVVENILIPVEEIKLEKPEEILENVSEGLSIKREPSSCDVCGECFNTRTKLFEHKKKHISCQTKRYKCTNCDKAFFTNFKRKVHMRSHTKETPYECKICLKKFRFASNIYRHVDVVHKGLKPFKCDICGKDFSRLERKVQHMSVHTSKCPYECKLCGKTFKNKPSLRYHEMDHNIKNGEIKDLSELKCNICEKIFSCKSSLRTHIDNHDGERKFLCSVCGRGFLNKGCLDIHVRTHTGEKPYQCKECGKRFNCSSGYKIHALFHTGLRCYKCDICLKTFKQSAHLKSHIRIHSGEKPFKCKICGKNFSQKSNLNVHFRIHTGETPYHCAICNKGFYDSSSMKKHKKKH